MKHKFSLGLTFALVLALLVSAAALADNLLTDGDGLTPVVDTPSLTLGNVCTGTTVTKDILHAISRQGTGTNVYANNAVVTVSITSVSGTGLSASGGGSITLPSNWTSRPNNTLSNTVSSSITFVAGATPRSFSGTVNYSASGSASTGGTLARTDSLTVTANVINCDTTPPTLFLPDSIIAEATGPYGTVVTFTATATDANPANPVVTCVPASGATFGFGTTTVNCSATDAAGNTATGSFTVTVQDTTPPAVTPPDNITMEAAGPTGIEVTYSGESAYDIVDGPRPVACAPVSGSTFALGETIVTCTASDTRGNTGSASFTVKVTDTTAPMLALPADITAEAVSDSGAVVTFSTSASDLVDGDIPVSCNWNSGDTFPLGETIVSCSVTDSNGNTASGSFKVTVVDTTPPILTLPASFSVEATGPSGAAATYSASASDLVDGSVAVTCSPASGSIFALGANAVSCSATDSAGNTANGSFTITVVDTTPPTLTLPADQQLEATGPSGAQAFFAASAYDIVDGALSVSCSASSGDAFPLGETTVDCSAQDAAGNKASGSFIIKVVDTTSPTITFVSRTPANAFGWNNGNVTVNWSCSDLVGVVSASVSETVSTEGANQSATGTCEDTSGNTASDTQTGINIDKTKPSASASRTPAANAFGWNNSDVTVSFSGTDALSGIDFCSAAQTFGEGAGQSASGTCTDKAGNVSDPAVVLNINVDKTAPTISGAPDRAPNANGWYNADVTVSFTCNDALSGVNTCTAPVTLGEGAVQSVTGSVTDKAGNTASFTVSGLNIDNTAPSITWNGGPAADGVYDFGFVPAAPTCSASDALSGPDGCAVSGYAATVGMHTLTAQAFDKAGNEKVEKRTYTVLAWTLKGFYQPVDMGGVYNTVKGGSTIPLKFEIFAGDTELTDPAYVQSLTYTTAACVSSFGTDEIETLVTGNTSLRYDAVAGQFIFNWKAPSGAGKCYRVTMTTKDGSTLVAYFKMK